MREAFDNNERVQWWDPGEIGGKVDNLKFKRIDLKLGSRFQITAPGGGRGTPHRHVLLQTGSVKNSMYPH